MYTRLISAFATLALLVGCAIHPLPEDVARVTSYDIVKQIRCETRDTIRAIVIGWLDILGKNGTVRAQQLADQYRADPASISGFTYELFNEPQLQQIKAVAKLFFDTGLAYSFELTGVEDNNLSADLSFLKDRPSSVFSLGAGAEANRKRANQRNFTVTDTFSGLIGKLSERFCAGQVVGPNYVYPIAGRIGVDKLVNDFIYMTLFGNLSSQGAAPGAPGLPYMVDELTFTTTFSGSANPRLVFAPVTPNFRIVSAELNAFAGRTDIHKVTVGVAIATSAQADLGPIRDYLFSRGRATSAGTAAGGSGLIIGARVIGGGTPSERLAVIAVDQVKSREIQLLPPL